MASGRPDRRTAMLLLLLSAHVVFVCGAEVNWSYDENGKGGPSKWPDLVPKCGGKHQSPVDLDETEDGRELPALEMDGYGGHLKNAHLVNDGHTAKLKADGHRASLSGGCLGGDKYHFVQAHFHWGRQRGLGSEHTVRGKPFHMEGHLVHFNSKYGGMEEAVNHEDGLAVLGVFYQDDRSNASRLQPLIAAVEQLSGEKDHKSRVDPSLTLRSLLPDDVSSFYCYRQGSLTTPPCAEAVVWTLLADPVALGRKQLDGFRQLKFRDGTKMVDNFRPVQALNGRTVYFHSSSRSACSNPAVLLGLLLLLPLLTRLGTAERPLH